VPTKRQLARLKKDIAAYVAEGFSSRRDIVGRYVDDPDEEIYGEVAESTVVAFVEEAIRSHHVKQATWTKPTDCDKLDTAFKTLERQGIVARQRFT
jgi:hypothetical protein